MFRIFFLLLLTSNICYSQIPQNFLQNKKFINQINSTRIINDLKPFKLHNGLSEYAKKICYSLQLQDKDTLLPNSIVLFNSDTIGCDIYLNKNLELLGIWSLPHKFRCQITVIIFDRILKEPVWTDFTCPTVKIK
jgi:hypothetical protein